MANDTVQLNFTCRTNWEKAAELCGYGVWTVDGITGCGSLNNPKGFWSDSDQEGDMEVYPEHVETVAYLAGE